MKTLTRAILKDYEVDLRRPSRVRGVQFGLSPAMLGLIDRRIDEANERGADIGLAAVDCGRGYAAKLREQEGLYTVFTRGELQEQPVDEERVVQCLVQIIDPEADEAALMALARDPDVAFLLAEIDPVGEFPGIETRAWALAARFLIERGRAHLRLPVLLAAGLDQDMAATARGRLTALWDQWNVPGELRGALEAVPVLPLLADALCERSDPQEAARLCERMNYRDAMIHLCEAFGRMAVQGRPEMLPTGFPAEFTQDLSPLMMLRQRLFEAGLFMMASVGPLRGCKTLADCLKDEPLRDLLGHTLLEEVLPSLPVSREEATPVLIECYERYQNLRQVNRLSDAGRGLTSLFRRSALPVLEACDRRGEPLPKGLTMGLSAAILLLADARPGESGWQTIVGGETVPLREAPEVLEAFSRLSSDMDAESLAYAVLSDRTLWHGRDLRQIDGLADRVTDNLSA